MRSTEAVKRVSIRRMRGGAVDRVPDEVAVEEPLSIRLGYWLKDSYNVTPLAVAMRTPGDDRELAVGLLLSEGIVTSADGIADIRETGTDGNEVLVDLAPGVDFETWRLSRQSVVNSACGICGKRSAEAISGRIPEYGTAEATASAAVIHNLPNTLRESQVGFAQTGGLHAAALFTAGGQLEALFEDVGRHNALDKLAGRFLLQGRLPLGDSIIFMSSRSSFEIVQKTAMAGCKILATVGGPSTLAIEAAEEFGTTLVGFVREQRFNVYTNEWRIKS